MFIDNVPTHTIEDAIAKLLALPSSFPGFEPINKTKSGKSVVQIPRDVIDPIRYTKDSGQLMACNILYNQKAARLNASELAKFKISIVSAKASNEIDELEAEIALGAIAKAGNNYESCAQHFAKAAMLAQGALDVDAEIVLQ